MPGSASPAEDHPLVISYFTPNTTYETLALRLERSCRQLGLAHRIEPRPAKKSWVENCAQKAQFVRDMHRAEGRPVLWIDADGVLKRPLVELAGTTADMAVVKRDGWSFYGGQIYFGDGPAARAILDRWCAYCQDEPQIWDQVSLGYAWWDVSLVQDVSALWLPKRISAKLKRHALGRLMQRIVSPAAIVHEQESRRSKAAQARGPENEFSTYDLPDWWKTAARADRPFPLEAAQRRELGLSRAVGSTG